MALNYDNLTAIVKSKYIPKLEDNIFNSSWAFQKMKEKPDVLDGGKDIHMPLQYAKGRGGAYSAWDLFDVRPKETRTAAIYDWRNLYANISISGDDEDKAAGSDTAILSFVEAEVQNAEATLIDIAAESFYNSGTDSTYPHGLRKIIGYNRTLGGIDSTTYTWWDSNIAVDINSNYSTTNLSVANITNPSSDYFILNVMRDTWIKCIHNRKHPDMILVSDGLWNILDRVLQPYMTYNYSSGTKAAADAGFQVLEYRGVPIVYDEYCPGSHMFYINTDFISMKIHRDKRFVMSPWQRPINQEARIAQILAKMQFVTGNPRYHGMIEFASAVS